jgi:hypothetical protein
MAFLSSALSSSNKINALKLLLPPALNPPPLPVPVPVPDPVAVKVMPTVLLAAPIKVKLVVPMLVIT